MKCRICMRENIDDDDLIRCTICKEQCCEICYNDDCNDDGEDDEDSCMLCVSKKYIHAHYHENGDYPHPCMREICLNFDCLFKSFACTEFVDDEAREKLRDIVKEYGRELCILKRKTAKKIEEKNILK